MKKHRGEYPMPAIQIPGWMSSPELEWLYQKAKEHRIIIEVGCAYGRSSHAILTGNWEGFGHEGKVYCVDPWPKPVKGSKDQFDFSYKDTSRRSVFFQRCGHFPNLNVIELSEARAHYLLIHLLPDMVFLDGGTANIAEEIRLWKHSARSLLCGHDYSEEYPEVIFQVDALGPGAQCMEDGTIWYLERKPCCQ